MSATFEMDDNGLCIIRCDPPVNGSDSFVFQPDVLVSWKALLGLASTREAIAAIMQGREDVSRYDPKTGRGVWTGAFEALESALADSATSVSMLAADGEVLDDPLTAARNRTRAGMRLPSCPTTWMRGSWPRWLRMMLTWSRPAASTRHARGMSRGWTPTLRMNPVRRCWTNARSASTKRSCQDKTNRIKEIDYGRCDH